MTSKSEDKCIIRVYCIGCCVVASNQHIRLVYILNAMKSIFYARIIPFSLDRDIYSQYYTNVVLYGDFESYIHFIFLSWVCFFLAWRIMLLLPFSDNTCFHIIHHFSIFCCCFQLLFSEHHVLDTIKIKVFIDSSVYPNVLSSNVAIFLRK